MRRNKLYKIFHIHTSYKYDNFYTLCCYVKTPHSKMLLEVKP